MLPPYAELHCLSNFSFLRGASHPEELVERAHTLGYAALALTDECSVAGVVRAHLAAKETGLKFIVGSEFTLADGLKPCAPPIARATATSRGDHAQPAQHRPRKLLLAGRRGPNGSAALWIPPAAGEFPAADARAVRRVFAGRAWIAAELHARSGDRARLTRLQSLSGETGLPLAAAGDVYARARPTALQDT
jgi:error-prone DNA polymerase